MRKRATINYNETVKEYRSGRVVVIFDDEITDISTIREAYHDDPRSTRQLERLEGVEEVEDLDDPDYQDSEFVDSDTEIESVEELDSEDEDTVKSEDNDKGKKHHWPDWMKT